MNLHRPNRFDIVTAIFFYLLNVVDCAFTLWVVQLAGSSMEMNPLMRTALVLGPESFIAVKLLGGGVLTLGLLFYPIPRRINVGLLFVTTVYFIFTTIHLYGIWRSHAY